MIYTALGDSITYGENATSLARAYPQLTVSALHSRSRKVAGYVLARPGWSSYDLLDAVIWRGTPVIHQSSVVTVWIGGVDLANAALVSLRTRQPIAVQQAISNYGRNLHAILTHIKNKSQARIICCTQYNPFPRSPLANEAIARLNRTTSEVARLHHVRVVPVHKWFEGRQAELIYGYRNGKIEDALSGFYPIHPNDRGHRVIASGLSPIVSRAMRNSVHR